MPVDATDEPSSAQKRMRKGTRSCLPCRRRKTRCTISGVPGKPCLECVARKEKCTAQGVVLDDNNSAKNRLQERVTQLEARLEQLISTAESSSGNQGSNQTSENTDALENLLASLRSAAHICKTQATDAISACFDEDDEEQVEDTVETGNAPILRLLKDATCGTNDSPQSNDFPAGPRSLRSRHSPKYMEAVRDLCAYLPDEAEMSDILDNQSEWWPIYRYAVCLSLGNKDNTTLRLFAEQALRDGHPTMLGLLLASIAISTGDPKRFLPPVERRILNDDEYAGMEFGLSCLMAMGICYLSALQPRRAWTVFRRANTLLQLNGIHLTHSRSIKQDLVFWQLVHADRWCSLFLGLPYMLVDHFCDMTIAPLEVLGPNVWVDRQLVVMSGRVIDYLQQTKGCSLAGALEIEEKLEEIRRQAPPKFLDLADVVACERLEERNARLFRMYHFYQLRLYANLPFLLRQGEQERFEFNRKTCVRDARRCLELYSHLFDSDAYAVFAGSITNFVAFTAAIVVLLSQLGHDQPRVLDEPNQWEQDWRRIYRTADIIRQGRQNKLAGLICQMCYTALESLVLCARGYPGEIANNRLVLPFFGTVSIEKQKPLEVTEEHRQHNPLQQQPQQHGQPHTSHSISGRSTLSSKDTGPSTTSRSTATSSPWPTTETTTLPLNPKPPPNHPGMMAMMMDMPLEDIALNREISFQYQGPFLPESNAASWTTFDMFGTATADGAGFVPGVPTWGIEHGSDQDWAMMNNNLPPNQNF